MGVGKLRAAWLRSSAPRSLVAAMSFVADVIFFVEDTDFIRMATACRETERVPNGACLFSADGL